MEEEKPVFPSFPYKPYPIQLDFMNALYQSLENGGIAMLESPTGTGKTLSIICSALQWLVDRKKLQNDRPDTKSGSDDEPDWMQNFVLNTETKASKKEKNTFFRKDNFNKKEKQEVFLNNESSKMKVLKGGSGFEGVDDEEFLMEEYESEGENGGNMKRKSANGSVSSSSEDDDDDDEEKEEPRLKIYFCSRTHSQLSQFIKELRKTEFANELNVVCLGSRKNFCINEDVLKLGAPSRINEKCLDLQRSKKKECCKVSKTKNLGIKGRVRRTKASSGCPMLRSRKIEKEFRSEISQQGPLDIEDLVHIGRKLGTCPYYGSRNMVPEADLVVLPYQSLLSKSSRESLGLSLKDNVVIIDEAHNLADSLISMYDTKVTLSQLEHVHSHLESYLKRFQKLLGPGNRRYIQTLMVLARAFLQILCHGTNASNAGNFCNAEGTESGFEFSMAINEFLFSLNIDNINLVKLVYYVQESNIIHKVCGYGDKLSTEKASATNDSEKCSEEGSSLSGFQALLNMLLSLTNKDSDGRVIVSRARLNSEGHKGGYLKYVMLSGEKLFSEVLDQARAVILAGGTLQPIEETKERLFPSLQPEKLHFFSCGHIIPSENILPIAISHGPSGHSFDFSYNTRSSSIMVEELGLLICNLVTLIPEGIIVFFSSFDYEALVHNSWKESGILARITKKKRIYREPRKNTEVEVVLREYKATIEELSHTDTKSQNGAILLAIVGGKISEGINFSDGMGRCIIMVGLPYPSPSDIELIERVKHIEGIGHPSMSKTQTQSFNGDAQAGLNILRSCKNRGKQYYENLCIKALNQSIGRAIRHIEDYAAILLVDGRYASDPTERKSSHLTNKLPQWIKTRLVSATKNYGEVHRLLHHFFKFHKDKVNKSVGSLT